LIFFSYDPFVYDVLCSRTHANTGKRDLRNRASIITTYSRFRRYVGRGALIVVPGLFSHLTPLTRSLYTDTIFLVLGSISIKMGSPTITV